jgi:hypothetical protein
MSYLHKISKHALHAILALYIIKALCYLIQILHFE